MKLDPLRTLRWLGIVVATFAFVASSNAAIKRTPPVEAKDHPEAVLITARDSLTNETARSTGVLIAANVVLTAAHGINRFDTWEITAPYAKKAPITVSTRSAKVHPDFQRDPIPNDIGVLFLADKIDIGRGFPALHDGELFPIDSKLLVVGRVTNGKVSGDRLYKGLAEVVPFPGNTNVYGGLPQTVEEGDSGGPVYLAGKEDKLIGLVSGHLGAGRANVKTDAFTPINRRNRAWIMRQVEQAVAK